MAARSGFKAEFDISSLLQGQHDKAERALRAAGAVLARTVVLNLSKAGHGIAYPRGGGHVHVASAPGESPAPDTGLMRSKVSQSSEIDGDTLVERVVTNVEYAAPLETGTDKIAARPHQRRSFEDAKGSMSAAIGRIMAS